MLGLQSKTSARWLQQVDAHLSEILVDHALCEMKAASTALNLMFAYIGSEPVRRELPVIVQEELEHFDQVLAILRQRDIPFRRIQPGAYGKRLHERIRKQEPGRAIDRLLTAALIEARSCERFDLLARHLDDRELARFFGGLFESEARHYATYVRLAGDFASRAVVRQRLAELAAWEAEAIAAGDALPRVHS